MPTSLRTARHSRATAACMSRRRAGSSARASRSRHSRTRTLRRGPVVHRRAAHRLEQLAASRAGERAECHRRIGHAECGVADSGIGRPRQSRHDRQGIHVRGLALVGRHAGGGVALHMLDRAKALAARRWQILRRHIVLEIDERRAVLRRRRSAAAAAPAVGSAGRLRTGAAVQPAAGSVPSRQAGRQIECCRCRHRPTVRSPTASPGRNAPQTLVEAEPAARLREQMHRRRPAAAHQHRIAWQRVSPFDSVAAVTRSRPLVPATVRRRCEPAIPDARAAIARRWSGALIDNRGDRHAGRMQSRPRPR